MLSGRSRKGKRSSSDEFDPLLKDLTEKKLTFRHSVSLLAAELRDVRSRLASKGEEFVKETLIKEVAETKARSMEEEVGRLRGYLKERSAQLEASVSVQEKYQKELHDLRSQLADTQAAADNSAASAKAAQSQCLSLMKELDEKNSSLKKHKIRVDKLEQQLDILQKDLQAREMAQKQLRDEVLRIEGDLMHSIVEAGDRKDFELRKIVEEVLAKEFCIINEYLQVKDKEITRMRDEIRLLSENWQHKAQELESQVGKQWTVNQELKKKIAKLEFCLQELQSEERKLQRMEEKGDDTLKELTDQLPMKQKKRSGYMDNQNFWESSGFKFVLSISMLFLIVFSKG